MSNTELLAGALSLLLRHDETGCRQSARQASCLLARISDTPELDLETRSLCERASYRLADVMTGRAYACAT